MRCIVDGCLHRVRNVQSKKGSWAVYQTCPCCLTEEQTIQLNLESRLDSLKGRCVRNNLARGIK